MEGSECSSLGRIPTNSPSSLISLANLGPIPTNSPSSLISLANLLELAEFEERAESNSYEFAEFVDFIGELTRTR